MSDFLVGLNSSLQESWRYFIGNVTLFYEYLFGSLNLIGILDLLIVVAIFWWLYKKLRRSDLIKILPSVFLLLAFTFLARLIGLWVVFYVLGFLLIFVLFAIAFMYANDIRTLLEFKGIKFNLESHHKPQHVTPLDFHAMVKNVSEALAVLLRAGTPALIIIKKDKPVSKLIENSNKMHSTLKPELLIDFFSSKTVMSRGAAVLDGNKIVAAGSTLWRPNAKVLFSPTNKDIERVAKDLQAVAIITNKTLGSATLMYKDQVYKNLTAKDVFDLLQNIFIFHKL